MASIPLDCTICPKKPKFSDVSHLLTHIASKGHLSHYYKLKVKSSTDPTSRVIIDGYDQWYAGWNVEGLMSERMSLKDKKHPRARQDTRASSVASSGPSQPRGARGGPAGSKKLSLHLRNLQAPAANLDPRVDPNHSRYQGGYNLNLNMMSMAPQNSSLPPMHPQLMQENVGSMMSRPRPYDPFNYRHESFADRHPQMSRTGSNYSFEDFKDIRTHLETDNLNSTHVETSDLSSPPDEIKTPSWTDESLGSTEDHTKLKGIHWPGMSLFDSATPGSKRKRNQKKEPGRLEQLEAESLTFEATEQVWTPNGNLRKEKRISGMPSSSPMTDVTTPPPKSPRTAASQANGRRIILSQIDGRDPSRAQLSRRATWADDELESEMTWGPSRLTLGGPAGKKRRKKGIEVWEDEDGGDRGSRTATFSHPRQMTQLTRGFTPQQENIPPEAYAYSNFVNKYNADDADVFIKQAPRARPIEPSLFNTQALQQHRFSLAQPAQTAQSVAVNTDLITSLTNYSAGMFGFSASNTIDPTTLTPQQFHGNLTNGFFTPVRSASAVDFVQQNVHGSHMAGQTFTPNNSNSTPFGMLPSFANYQTQTPGTYHVRDNSTELRNALAASQPVLPTSNRSTYSFFQDVPRTFAEDTTPIRRTQSFPSLISPMPNGGLQTLSDVVTLMDTVAEGRTPALSVRQLLAEQSPVEDLVDTKDTVDDDRTITAPGTPEVTSME